MKAAPSAMRMSRLKAGLAAEPILRARSLWREKRGDRSPFGTAVGVYESAPSGNAFQPHAGARMGISPPVSSRRTAPDRRAGARGATLSVASLILWTPQPLFRFLNQRLLMLALWSCGETRERRPSAAANPQGSSRRLTIAETVVRTIAEQPALGPHQHRPPWFRIPFGARFSAPLLQPPLQCPQLPVGIDAGALSL